MRCFRLHAFGLTVYLVFALLRVALVNFTLNEYMMMVIRSSGKFLKYLSKMLSIRYNKCQKGLHVGTE